MTSTSRSTCSPASSAGGWPTSRGTPRCRRSQGLAPPSRRSSSPRSATSPGPGGGGGLAGPWVVVWAVGELTQLVVPVGFQGGGDEPVAGVHGEVAAACGLGCVAGALHAGGADPVGL